MGFKALGLNDKDFKFGTTKVFFRPGKFAEFDQIMRTDPKHLSTLIEKVSKWLVRCRWRKVQWCALEVIKLKNKILFRKSALITVQSYCRMFLMQRKHTPRYKGIASIRKLESQVEQIRELGAALKSGQEEVHEITDQLLRKFSNSIDYIKNSDGLAKENIEILHQELVQAVVDETNSIKKKIEEQKIYEEEQKLLMLQEEISREKARKEAELEKKKEAESERLKKIEFEKSRKADEEEERRLEREERDKNHALALQKRLEDAESKYAALKKQIEQERRDHELALRLAEECRGGIDDLFRRPQRSVDNSTKSETNEKFDLSKWKYAELRDTINTSCDIELLEACREEFHRRLEVYHAWKAKNKKSSNVDTNMRAPSILMEESQKIKLSTKKVVEYNSHRYFKIPFVRPGTGEISPAHQIGKGWWFAHFDGQWIARQMELHDGKRPITLIAGEDDMHMCELSLDETGLTRKRGAEISEMDFEKEWKKQGGKQYSFLNDRK